MAAKEDSIYALYRLAQLNYQEFESDRDKWFPWFLKAAELGDPASSFWIGMKVVNAFTIPGYFYHQGIGVPESFEVATAWLKKAAKGGSKEAMHYLSILYLDPSLPVYNIKVGFRYKLVSTHTRKRWIS